MTYQLASSRYDAMQYRRCGRSGLLLPAISLACGTLRWCGYFRELSGDPSLRIRFGYHPLRSRQQLRSATGSAEENFGRILYSDFAAHRDELIISTKAGYTMWPGPYGDWGSRKYAGKPQSEPQTRSDYVDIFIPTAPIPKRRWKKQCRHLITPSVPEKLSMLRFPITTRRKRKRQPKRSSVSEHRA